MKLISNAKFGVPVEESLIVADPKGELYRKTAECAKAHGYTVKIFNTTALYTRQK